MIRNTGRRPVICTCKNHIARGFRSRTEMLRWQEKNSEEFENTYHQRSIVESVFSSLKCRFTASCSRKETGNAKTAAAPQVHLLQPAVIVERRKKYVSCVWRMLYNSYSVLTCKIHLARSCYKKIPSIYRKSKAIKCR